MRNFIIPFNGKSFSKDIEVLFSIVCSIQVNDEDIVWEYIDGVTDDVYETEELYSAEVNRLVDLVNTHYGYLHALMSPIKQYCIPEDFILVDVTLLGNDTMLIFDKETYVYYA